LEPMHVAPLEAPSLALTKASLEKDLSAPCETPTLEPLFTPLELEHAATLGSPGAGAGCSRGICSLGAEQVASLEAPILEPLFTPLEPE
jgi:hypothetical protein